MNFYEAVVRFKKLNTEEENDSVYEKDYKFLGEEIGCLDYIENIVNQKTLSNYFIIDYSSSQDELLDKWSESLYASGQMGKEDLANKPENIREKIVEGRLHKILAQKCLLEQAFVKDPSMTVAQ